MTSVELLDSKRFCAFMDRFVKDWLSFQEDGQKVSLLDELWTYAPLSAEDDDYVPRLPRMATQEELDRISPPIRAIDGVESIEPLDGKPKRKGGRPKGSKNAPKAEPESVDRAALKSEHTRPLTEAEKRETLAQLAKEKPARDPQLIVNDAVLEVIVPNWAKTPVSPDGHRHFIVNAERKQERVSFELDKWKAALSLNKLPAGSVVFKPEGLGMSPGSLETGRAGNAWRVMIG